MSDDESSSLGSDALAVLDSVNWDAIGKRIAGIYQVQSFTWGRRTSGAFNFVRFVELHGHGRVIVLPRVIYHTASSEEAGRPFIVMSCAEGVALTTVWDDMGDRARDFVLEQVADILIQLSCQRFDSIGRLSGRINADGQREWLIKPEPGAATVFHSGTLHQLKTFNNRLEEILRATRNEIWSYAQTWWVRSLVPVFYDDSLDADGFPLDHGDFHSQNIFVVDADTDHPRISCVIDWDDAGSVSTSFFAKPPLFIVDHPYADPSSEETKKMAKRNIRDQDVLVQMIGKAEAARGMSSTLSGLYQRSKGVYLLDQCSQGDDLMALLYSELVQLVVGDEDTHFNWIVQTMDSGVLKPVQDEFLRKYGEVGSELTGEQRIGKTEDPTKDNGEGEAEGKL
ncbi:hypothetical protein BKA62DRAFT_709882 [Auriculariales sp. MPI-PUGE-AT-0066]|nr:hypothetical protein BKA62DRAFT_709882 [Auriculariales sp. MPI-PUGE-AT-0066]